MGRTVRVLTVALLLASASAAAEAQTLERGSQKVQEGFGEAVTAPLEDLNVKRDEIPAVLIEAVNDTYGMRNLDRCEAYAHEIYRLDLVLGPDMDTPQVDDRLPNERNADTAAEVTLEAVKDTATDLIPMRSWVRRLTGAAAHDKQVKQAILAGSVRRSFLKGVGYAKGCPPPAAPRRLRQPASASTLAEAPPVG